MTATLPLFPLNAVLFPDGPLKLRIFEARYVDMISRCMREGSSFGVALIVEGTEAGGPARTADIGTAARIVDFEKLRDGLLGITALGDKRFSIASRSQQADALHIAQVEWLDPELPQPIPDDCGYLVLLLQHALPRLAPLYDYSAVNYEDASWVSARLVEILPLPLPEKQRCLEMRDALERLEYLRVRVKVETQSDSGLQ